MDFITTNNLIIIPVLSCIGFVLKTSKHINDNDIPFFILLFGAILGLLNSYGFDGVLQGVLCAAVAMGIYDTGHMVYKARIRNTRNGK